MLFSQNSHFSSQCFVNLLCEKLNSQGEDFLGSAYWHWVSGHLRQLGREFQKEVDSMKFTIGALVFDQITLDPIIQIWQGLLKVYEVQE